MIVKLKNYLFLNNNVYKKTGKATLMLCLVLIAFLWIIPFLLMLNTSFKNLAQAIQGAFSLPDPITVQPYENAFNSLDFGSSFMTTIFITILSNVTIVFFSSLIAWQLSRCKKWYSKVIFYLFLITVIVPFQAIMLPLITVMGKINFLNIFGLIFMYTGFGMSISIFMMHGFLSNVPLSLEEVGKIEGYNPLRVYFKIILPLLKPIIATIVILNTMWIWNDFLLPYLVFIANTQQKTTLVVNLFNTLIGQFGTDITTLTAGLTILIIPIIVFFVILQRYIVSGITGGAIK